MRWARFPVYVYALCNARVSFCCTNICSVSRAMFCNLDVVKDRLILCVVGLAMKAHKLVKAKHSKKTANFVKACLAYCHITIPSLPDG